MIRLPEIDSLERAQGSLSLRFVVPATIGYFDGHFPDCPLLPGVVQVGWAVELARSHLALSRSFRALAGVKFMRVIQPGAQVHLMLSLGDDGRELSFAYESDGQACSGGRVLFH